MNYGSCDRRELQESREDKMPVGGASWESFPWLWMVMVVGWVAVWRGAVQSMVYHRSSEVSCQMGSGGRPIVSKFKMESLDGGPGTHLPQNRI